MAQLASNYSLVPYLHHIKSMNLRISYGGINVLFQLKLRVAGTFDYPLVLPCFDGHFKKIHSQITGRVLVTPVLLCFSLLPSLKFDAYSWL